jgi:hypothetical protein
MKFYIATEVKFKATLSRFHSTAALIKVKYPQNFLDKR